MNWPIRFCWWTQQMTIDRWIYDWIIIDLRKSFFLLHILLHRRKKKHSLNAKNLIKKECPFYFIWFKNFFLFDFSLQPFFQVSFSLMFFSSFVCFVSLFCFYFHMYYIRYRILRCLDKTLFMLLLFVQFFTA